MTSYLSSLSSHYNSIKRLLPTHLSPDADNSISDPSDSHVSRVLRAYYTEKGRPFPAWLGPDPNAPAARAGPAAYVTQAARSSGPATSATSVRPQRGGGGLGDLFDDRPPSSSGIPLQQEEPLSLRSRRGAVKSPTPTQTPPPQQPLARPLPSQRLGSYQNRAGDQPASTFSPPVAKEQSASERLRARLGGSRTGSPASTPSPNSVFDNPMSGSRGANAGFNPYEASSFNPYETGSSSGGAGGNGSGFNPYESSSGGARNPYASSATSSNGATQKSYTPYTAASSPWTNGDDGGYGGDLGTGSARTKGFGLPSNPKSRR
jgi:hypothetical protein